ncbi:MAG TPA: hypothetical protein VIQ05_26050, partial [Tardiphaga sp.]
MANHRDTGRRLAPSRISAALVAVLPLLLAGSAGHAQGMMRSPTINIGARVPTIAPNAAARVNPNIAGRPGVGMAASPGRIGITAVTPAVTGRMPVLVPRIARPSIGDVRYSPNTYPGCAAANRDASGACKE